MAVVVPVYGIVAANGGDQPRRASLIFYSVDLNMPSGLVRIDNVQPHNQRPPDDVVDTLPLPVGTPFTAYMVGGEVQFIFHELPAYGPCQPPAFRSFIQRALGNVRGGTLPAPPMKPAPI